MIALLLMAQAAVVQVPHTPPAPPVPPPIGTSPPSIGPSLIDFRAGPVRCAGQEVAATAPIRPIPALGTVRTETTIAPFAIEFDIGADGRTRSIRPATRPQPTPFIATDDLQPAVAAARFAPGFPRTRCNVQFEVVAVPVEQAPIALIHRYYSLPHQRGYGEQAVERRIRDELATCNAGGPPVMLLRAFPDFERIPQAPGALSMTMVGFDIGRDGRPTRVRTETSDGNPALDAAGRSAVAQSRFRAGAARTGCTYPYHRRQTEPVAAPSLPELASYRPAGSTCEALDEDWTLPPRMTFPAPFGRRAIEGVAVVRYDVAPWGQTGNVVVLASEPAAAFGTEAQRIVQQARRAPSATGATGCVERVVFKLPGRGTDAPVD
ncbi:TonB family C-terminal domain-containing protein [Sphingomonas guangdongensis]|uniref:TonB family C-terminal domain-containing protein n=1 Tax=Sphingomonas guangdongensis TaxID=1141890 RepID=A0A285R0X9_9SPHN|nr:TonB family protein [Sphingomonas guangdongensis]SOB87765.1 TonB family C-terminal domain-containing protein [Sphingomonas guangdongensis]